MRRLLFLVIALGLLILLAGCGKEKEEEARGREVAPAAVETPHEAVAPAKPERVRATAKTRATYQWYCAQCHGIHGKGDGINAMHLTVPPRNHTKADYLETRTDQQLFDTIQQGGLATGRAPCMPAWGHTLDESTIRDLVRYIRELCECEAL